MKLAALLFGVTLALGGCKDKKPEAPAAPVKKPCQTSADCEQGWLCLANVCADPRTSAYYKHPSEAVTPDKVRREVERIQEQHGADIDKIMKKAADPQ